MKKLMLKLLVTFLTTCKDIKTDQEYVQQTVDDMQTIEYETRKRR